MRRILSIVVPLLALETTQAHAVELFHDDFESGSDLFNPLPTGYGWNGAWSDVGDGVDVSTDIARSGTRSVRFTFGGSADITDDARAELRYVLGQNMNDVYIQWYQYFPNGTEGLGPKWSHRSASPSNNKFIRLWADVYSAFTIKVGASLWPTSGGDSSLLPDYGTSQTSGIGPYGLSGDTQGVTDARRGRWVQFVYHAKTATSANNDGVIQLWVDGTLTIDHASVPLYPQGGIGNYFRNGYLMGWSNSGFAQTTHTYIDDVTIADAPIDTSPAPKPKAPTNLQVQ